MTLFIQDSGEPDETTGAQNEEELFMQLYQRTENIIENVRVDKDDK